MAGGLVDTLIDTGSLGKNFVAIDASRRVGIATDGNGHPYLDFQSGSVCAYNAGVAADWTFMNNDLSVYSVCIIGTIHTAPTTNTGQGILATCEYASSSRGFAWGVGNANTGASGTGFETFVLDASAYNARIVWRNRDIVAVSTQPRIWTANYNRLTDAGLSAGLMGFTSSVFVNSGNTMDLWQNYHQQAIASNIGMRTVSTSAPARGMTLGGFRNGATGVDIPLKTMRIYEIIIFPQNVSGHTQYQLAKWAGTEYDFDPNLA
jgi:hypothetical protein